MKRDDRVLFQVFARVFGTETDIGVRGEMENDVVSRHLLAQARKVKKVTMNESESRLLLGPIEKLLLAGRKVIVDGNLVSISKQAIHQVAADEACPAGHECMHRGDPDKSEKGTALPGGISGSVHAP
jgi:hypothetical protein